MTEDYQNIEIKKVTARVPLELAERVQSHLHSGQQQALFRQIFASLAALFESGNHTKITDYIYGSKALTLKPVKEKK